MFNIIQALFLAAVGNSTIYAGLAFVNAKLLPGFFNSAYQHMNMFWRLLVMLVVCSMLANYLFATVYRLVDAGYAGMLILGTLVLVMIAKAILIEGTMLNARIVVATLALMLMAAWVAYELHHTS